MERYVCVPNSDTFDFWIANNLNVLFYGRHGVGKTSMILDAFNKNKLKYQTFSASTMDPWVDFIGVPKEINDEKGAYLELIRPKAFRDDEVEALFFDELNRSHKKIRNAIMELIQFKSINGRKFPKLRFIWGAVNPSEDDDLKYDVEQLDPAQADRFHIQVEIPYRPHAPYLREKYGRQRADAAIEWWNDLSEKMQLQISPRRLEYAIQIHEKQGNLAFVLPQNSNIAKLSYSLSNGSPKTEYTRLLMLKNEENLTEWLQVENNYSAVEGCIITNPVAALHLLSEERIIALASKNNSVAGYIFENYATFKQVVDDLADNSQDKHLKKCAQKVSTRQRVAASNIYEIQLPKSEINNTLRIRNNDIVNSYKWNEKADLVFSKMKKSSTAWYHATLEACVSFAMLEGENTIEKLRILNSLARIVNDKSDALTVDEAKTCLNIIDSIIGKMQIGTIMRKTDNLNQTINRCIRVLRNRMEIASVNQFVSKYPFISAKYMWQHSSSSFDLINLVMNKAIISG